MILVIGATGKVGSQAVRRLAGGGVAVRAFCRDPSAMPDLGAGVEAVQGDLDRPETLPPALAGVEKVLLIAAGSDLPTEEAHVIDAAQAAGVAHLVLLSSLGVEAGVASGPAHAPGEAQLRASGLAWTILRPAVFMANAMMWRDTIRAQGVFYEPTGTGRHSMIDPIDIGDVAAEVLSTTGHEGRTYELTGPEPISSADCAAALSAAMGTEVRHVDIPDEAFRQAMTGAGAPAPLVDALARYYALVRAGRFEMVSPAVVELLGRPAGTFAEWAAANAGAFASPT